MNATKAPGNDDINPALLKETSDEIAQQATDLFRSSLDSGNVPEYWI